MRPILALIGLTLSASVASAQSPSETTTSASSHAIVALPDQIKWGPAPASLPPGAQAAVLEGNPAEPGPFTLRLKAPDGYRIPPHYHPAQERVTVIQGAFQVGMGDKFEESKLTTLPPGTYASLAPNTHHFARTKGETVIQLNGIGPWKLIYVNPADAPQPATP